MFERLRWTIDMLWGIGFCQCWVGLLLSVPMFFLLRHRFESGQYVFAFGWGAVGPYLMASGAVIVAAARALRRGRGRVLGVVAAWLALFSPLLIGLPIGFWALRMLHRPEVRAAFTPGIETEP